MGYKKLLGAKKGGDIGYVPCPFHIRKTAESFDERIFFYFTVKSPFFEKFFFGDLTVFCSPKSENFWKFKMLSQKLNDY